jgi:hypothetical protein
MEKKDSDAVLSMIMDVSGARDTVEDALGMLNKLNFFGRLYWLLHSFSLRNRRRNNGSY